MTTPETAPSPPPADFRMTRTLRLLARGKNVNPETLLSTDYLNHFNEIVMLIEMVPSMPECMEDIRAWRPKTYAEHFRDSGFADKELAILAYENAPPQHRAPFDRSVDRLNDAVATAVREIGAALEDGTTDLAEAVAQKAAMRLHALIDVTSGIINGQHAVIDQSRIDRLLDGGEPPAAGVQAVVDTVC
jgi:hypothetical protein